jgi:hypothetical protein
MAHPVTVDLEAIRARLAAATPGPWFAGTTNHVFQADVGNVCAVFPHGADIGEHNTYLIAHAPADIAALLDRCDQLEQAGNTLAAAIAPLVGPDSDVSHFISAWEIGHTLDGEEQADIVTAALQAWRDVAGEAK